MGERRASAECGPAVPLTLLSYLNFGKPTRKPSEANLPKDCLKCELSDADEFVGEHWDELNARRSEKAAEPVQTTNMELAEAYAKGDWRLGKTPTLPHFTDFRQRGYATTYDVLPHVTHLWHDVNHCIGNLGEDHPTCRKALWYYHSKAPPHIKQFHEDMTELGHWDAPRQWGIKPYLQYLPLYQPVKQKIPGAYEFFNSTNLNDVWKVDGSGDVKYFFTIME